VKIFRRDRSLRRHLLALLALVLALPLLAQEPSPVRAELLARSSQLLPGQVFALDLILDIDGGWHVYGPDVPSGALGTALGTGLPTTIAWDLPPGFTVLPLEWPPLTSFSFGGVESRGYTGRLVLHASMLAPKDLAAGSQIAIKARVDWLACKDACMPGGADLALSLPAAAGGLGLALALGLAFLGGLILNLMPCVLPVLSLKALSLAKSAGGRRPLAQGLYFTAGVLVSFWLFAAILLGIRAGGASAGWGFQLQNPVFVAVAALAFFLMALSLFGVFELGVSLTRLGSIGVARGGSASSFLTGFFATAVATPCTAPFMGVAIGYALSHGTAAAFGIFTALGLGMAAPLFAISALPGLARRLPRSGPWMLRFRQALGFPLMAALVWMAFVLSDLAGARALLSLLEGLLAAGLGAWLWGSWGGPDRRRGGRLVAAVLALALVAAGLLWAVRDLRPGTVPPSSAAALAAPEPSERGDGFWTAWSEARVAELRAQGHPVFVDFTAAWCLSCQVNEALALDDRAVRARFSQLGIVALKADWTARDEAIGKGLAALGRASVPLYALYPAGSSQAVILPEILTPGIVLGYLDRNIAQGR